MSSDEMRFGPEGNEPDNKRETDDEDFGFEENADIYTLIDENGDEADFELVDMIEEDGKTYFAFVPYVEDPKQFLEDECEIVVLEGHTTDDDEMFFEPIEDDEEYQRIGEMFLERLNDEDWEGE